YLIELLDIFREEQVEGAFAFTFVSPSYPYSDDPRYDLDMASYSVVKTCTDHTGQAYQEMPWEPKEAFGRLAQYYKDDGPDVSQAR
ncbi:MAG TPA: abortive infection protein, partial [Ktedonobacterales bacterium]